MKRIISYILTVCLILTLAPVSVFAAEDPGYTGGTLVADYTLNKEFAESDFGQIVVKESYTESDGFEAKYFEDGITITRTGDNTNDSTGIPKFAINFATLIENDEANSSSLYRIGLSGIYAIEFTINPKFNVTGKRTDFYFNSTYVTDSSFTETMENNLRFYSNATKQIYWNGMGGTFFKDWTYGEDYSVRLVIDTVNGKIYCYDVNGDGTYSYIGESTFTGDALTSMTWSPRAYVGKGDSVTFKNLKVYEIQKKDLESENETYTDFLNALPDSIVDDYESVKENIEIPAELKNVATTVSLNDGVLNSDGVINRGYEDADAGISFYSKTSGVYYQKVYRFTVKAMEPAMLDYDLNKDFIESDLGKLVVKENFDEETEGFKATYSNQGITITRTGNDTTDATEVPKFSINLAVLSGKDDVNNTELYQIGLSGSYAVDITVKPEFSVTGKRTDFYFNDEISTDTDFAMATSNNLRFYSNATKQVYWNGMKGTFKDWVYGEDYTFRIVVDTVKGKIYCYDVNSDGTYSYIGESTYTGETLSSVTWAPRAYVGKGDSITFKNIKVYELSKNDYVSGNTLINNFFNILPESIVEDTENVINNISIPEDLSRISTVETLDKGIVSTNGVVTRGFEDTETGISFFSNTSGMYFKKLYKFTVKAMEGVDVKLLEEYDFSSQDIYNNFVSVINGQTTTNGYELTNTKEHGEVIGLLKTEKNSTLNTNTYYYDHDGAFDYEISLTPYVSDGSATVEVGNYNALTNTFYPYGKVKIYSDKITCCDEKAEILAVSEETNGNNYNFKFRTYTDKKNLWIWVNSKDMTSLPFKYAASADTLNAYRITFEDATVNDSIVLTEATLTQQLNSENTDVEACVNAAASIEMSDITSNPADAYGSISLPDISGVNVQWLTDNPLADLENKFVFRTDRDTDITLSALISSVSNPEIRVLKTFHITVMGTNNPEELLQGALAKIVSENITNQNPQALIADLSLPSVTKEGYAISWESLNDDIISDDGKINRTINISEPKKVSFKFTVTSESGSVSKNISFMVAKRGADAEVAPAQISKSAENVVTYSAIVSNTNGSAYLQDDTGNKVIGFSINGSTLTFEYGKDNSTEFSIDGNDVKLRFVMNSADNKLCVFADDKLILDYVSYAERSNGFKSVVNNGLTLSNEKVILDEYSLFDYNVKTNGYFDNFGLGYVTDDITLKTDSVGGVKVEWTSDNQDIMNNTGTYTAPDFITPFDISVKLAKENGTGAYYEATENYIAVPDESKNLFSGATVSTNIKSDIAYDKSKGFDNDFSTCFQSSQITKQSYITIDMGVIKDINSVYFFRDFEDASLKSCDIYVSEDGTTWLETPVASVIFEGVESNHVTFDLQNARYIKIANIEADNNMVKLYEIKGYVSYSSDDKAYMDILALDMPTDYILEQTSLSLPTIGSVYGSKLTWTSSDNNVISLNGMVTKPEKKKEVVLTVKAEYEGKTSVKSYIYLVEGTGSSGGSGGGGGTGGSFGGNVSGVQTGGTGIASLPEQPENVNTPVEIKPMGIFNDVSEEDWYYVYLLDLKEKGIVDGYDDGKFYPNNKVTREEFVKMLVSAAGVDLTENDEGFNDVKVDAWYAPYVYTAKESGIVNGIDSSNFGVGLAISRQDMSVMLYNLLDKEVDLTDNRDLFADHTDIAWYAYNAVYTMKAVGILDGYETGEFRPKGNLTRAEAVKVISLIITML